LITSNISEEPIHPVFTIEQTENITGKTYEVLLALMAVMAVTLGRDNM
jgi:hypothetical protein